MAVISTLVIAGAILLWLNRSAKAFVTVSFTPMNPFFPSIANPFAVAGAVWAALMPIYFAMITLLTVCSLASVISLLPRLTWAQGDERLQIKR